jgi:hypothetical protein
MLSLLWRLGKPLGLTASQQDSTKVDGVKWKAVFATLQDQYGSIQSM